MEAPSGIPNLGDQMMEGGEMALLAATFSDSRVYFAETIKNRKAVPENVCLFFREREVCHSQKCIFLFIQERESTCFW